MKLSSKIEIALLITLAIWTALSFFLPETPTLLSLGIIFIPLLYAYNRLWMKDHNANLANPIWHHAYIACEFVSYALLIAWIAWKLYNQGTTSNTTLYIIMVTAVCVLAWLRKHIDNS